MTGDDGGEDETLGGPGQSTLGAGVAEKNLAHARRVRSVWDGGAIENKEPFYRPILKVDELQVAKRHFEKDGEQKQEKEETRLCLRTSLEMTSDDFYSK